MLCFVGSAIVTVTWEKRPSTEKLPSPGCPLVKFMGAYFWLIIYVGRAQVIMDGATPGQVVVSHIGKHAEQIMESKSIKSFSSWLVL